MGALIAVLLTLFAQANPPSNADAKARAQALLKDGNLALGRGDPATALAKFQAAFAEYPSPKLHFNIALAQRDLDRPVEAMEAFQRFLAQPSDAPADLLADARRSVSDLSSKLGRFKIECAVAGADIAVDGKPIGTTPLPGPIWTLVGPHRIALQHARHRPLVVSSAVGPGEIVNVTLQPLALVDRPTQSPPSLADPLPNRGVEATVEQHGAGGGPLSRQKWHFWAAAGGTVLFAAGAIVAGRAANARYSELEGSCGRSNGCSESQIDGVKVRANVANALWILTGVSAVAAGVSLYVNGQDAGVSLAGRF